MRHETWSHVCARVDTIQLSSAMWSPGNDNTPRLQPIALTHFSNTEVKAVIARYRSEDKPVLEYAKLSKKARKMLQDPFLLHVAINANLNSDAITSSNKLMTQYIQRKLTGFDAHLQQASINALIAMAGLAFSRRARHFRSTDLEKSCYGNTELIRVIGDSGLIQTHEKGWLRFEHDRTEEFFLAQAIAVGENVPTLESLQDLADILRDAPDEELFHAAGRRHLRSHSELFNVIEQGQALNQDRSPFDEKLTRKIKIFTKKALQETAANAPEFVATYGTGAISAGRAGRADADQVSTALQAVALLNDKYAIPILLSATNLSSPVLSSEAWIYLMDRLADKIICQVPNFSKMPWSELKGGASKSDWRDICILLGLMSKIGPDNSTADHYNSVVQKVGEALDRLLQQASISDSDIKDIVSAIVSNLDRYGFNACQQDVEQFFANHHRAIILSKLDIIKNRKCLDGLDIQELSVLMDAEEYHFEFLLLNILLALSALNNFDQTSRICTEHTKSFNSSTPAQKIDFFTGVAAYTHIICSQPYNGYLDKLTKLFTRKLSQVFFHNPGLTRGIRRGWQDTFDRLFEDGFNPIAGYSLLAAADIPDDIQKRIQDGDGIDEDDVSKLFPVFQEMMTELIANKDFDKLIRIIHALGQTFCVWPYHTIYALTPICGVQDLLVRRSLTRVLEEMFARRPQIAQQFLDHVQGSFTKQELSEIRSGENARVGHRQFETVEWARLLRFLIVCRPNGITSMIKILEILCTADNLNQALEESLSFIGIY